MASPSPALLEACGSKAKPRTPKLKNTTRCPYQLQPASLLPPDTVPSPPRTIASLTPSVLRCGFNNTPKSLTPNPHTAPKSKLKPSARIPRETVRLLPVVLQTVTTFGKNPCMQGLFWRSQAQNSVKTIVLQSLLQTSLGKPHGLVARKEWQQDGNKACESGVQATTLRESYECSSTASDLQS